MVVNKLRHQLDQDAWQITVVDQDDAHLYQPGLLLLPFGVYSPEELIKPRRRFIPDGVELLLGEIDRVKANDNRVSLSDGRGAGLRLSGHRLRDLPAS
jgi:sulfide:quinone oxidoreductase